MRRQASVVIGGVVAVLASLIPAAVGAQDLAGSVVVAGGPAAVSDGVIAELAELIGASVPRVAGDDRYATAAAAAQAFRPGVPVLVASGEGYADALAGGPLATVTRGPILLTRPGDLPAATEAALERLAPSSIVVLGGEAAVSVAVEEALGAFTAAPVGRLAGADRYATAAAVAAALPGPVGVVYVASGEAFPDALAGSAVAGAQGAPILLTRQADLPAATSQALADLAPERIVVLGGVAAVSAAVEAELAAVAVVERLGGADRFATAAAIAESGYPDGAEVVHVASGASFADALAIAPVAAGAAAAGGFAQAGGGGQGPVLLTDPDVLPDAVRDAIRRLLGLADDPTDEPTDDPTGPPVVENTAPTAVDVRATTAAGQPVVVGLVASDAEDDPLTFALASAPGHGTAVLADDEVTYTPATGFAGTDSFTYTASDGALTSAPATVTVTVQLPAGPGNALPVVNLDPGGADEPDVVTGPFTEDGGPLLLVPAATVDDPDGAALRSVTATLDAVPNGAAEVLAVDVAGTTLQATYDPLTGTLTVSPTGPATEAPEAEFQTVLRTLTYDNADQDPDTGDRTITVVASDGADSDPATATLPVAAVDDAPVAVDDLATVAEDAAATAVDVLANDTDVDAGPIAIVSVDDAASNGSVTITNAGADLTYTPNADYCNDPPGTTPDTFTYTLAPGGSTATVSVTVTCVDDAPVAVADAATVAEDDPATTVDVLANDTDVDAGAIALASVTQPVNGTVVVTNGGADLTYAPNADYCNDPPGTTPDTFTYTLAPGGSTATVSVTVTCVDDAPAAVADAATVAEDDPATTVVVLANDTDVDAGAIAVTAVTQPANGTVVITNAGADLTYEPDADYCNTPPGTVLDTFTYTLTPGGSAATVSVTVDCEDDAPVAVDDTPSVTEDSVPVALPVLGNDTDVDGGDMFIASATDPANGTVVLTGGTSGAHTGLTYEPDANYCNTPPGATLDTFTYTLTPGGSVATVSVTVTCVDDPPVAVADAATVVEDSGANTINVQANDNDLDGGTNTIDSVTQPINGTVAITNGGADLTYAPNLNYCNDGSPLDTFSYTLNGGSSATVSVTVTCVDDAPVAVADGPTVIEDSGANAVDVLANDTDVDDGPISVTSVTQPANGTVAITGGGTGVSYTPNANYCNNPPGTTLETFTYTLTPGGSSTTVTVTVTCVDDDPTAVAEAATVSEDSGANAIDVLANDNDVDGGPKTVQSVTQPTNGTVAITGGGTGVSYTPNANYCNNPPGTTLETFTYTLTPGGSSTTVTITVTCVDDPPVAVADAASVSEDSGANAVDVLVNDTDVDGGPISVASVTQPAGGAVVITGGGTGVSYTPNANYCNDPPGTTLDTFTYTLTPGGSSTTVTVTVTCVNDAPVGVADAFDALANTRLAVSAVTSDPNVAVTGNVLTNDTDVDSPQSGFTTVAGLISSTGCPGCNNVTMNTDGTFTYDPPPGVTTTDAFTYTLSDNDTDEGAAQTGTGTVNIDLVGPVIWYVDEDVVAAGSGTSHAPFGSLASLQSAGGVGDSDGPGDIIFLYTATAASTGGLPLEVDQRLLGEPFGLTVDPVGSLPSQVLVAANAGLANPVVTNAGPGITLANGVELQRVSADDATGAVDVAVGMLGTNVDNATIGAGVTASDNAGGGIRLIGGNGTITSAATIASNTGHPLYIQNRTGGTVTISGTMASTSRGVTLDNNDNATINITGAMTLGNTAANAGFVATNGGTVTATGAGNTLVATTGTLINIADTTIGAAGVTFTNVQSSGAANGILLSNAGAGPLTVSGGSITNATTRGVDVNAGNGNVTYNGTITTSGAAARSVEVTSRTGGTVDFNGLVTDTSTGINLVGNNAGLVRFDGGITASTGANTAFNATVSGNVAVTDTNGTTAPNNTLTTTSGTALNVQNITIHTDDLNFQSISANGAPSGIWLNSTAGSGRLRVTGDADNLADGGGGTITNTTDSAIRLTNTPGPSLTDMTITNAGNADEEHGIAIINVGGAIALDDMSLSGAAEDLINLDNTNTNAALTLTDSNLAYPATIGAHAANAIEALPNGTSAVTLTVQNTTFSNIRGNALNLGAGTAASSGASSMTFTGNTSTVTLAGRAGGVAISGQELTSTNLTIGGAGALGNTFNGAGGNGVISIDVNDASTVTGAIINNAINTPPGIGIFSAVDEAATSTLTFDANTITNSGGDGFQLVNFGADDGGALTSIMNATVTNNAVNGHSLNTAVNFVGAFAIFTNNPVDDPEDLVDLQLTGNTVTGTPASGTQCGGAPCVAYYLEEIGSWGNIRFEEIPDTGATTLDAAYVNAKNDAGPVTIFGIIDLSNGAEISGG